MWILYLTKKCRRINSINFQPTASSESVKGRRFFVKIQSENLFQFQRCLKEIFRHTDFFLFLNILAPKKDVLFLATYFCLNEFGFFQEDSGGEIDQKRLFMVGKMAKVIIMMVTRHEYIVGIYFSIILLRGEFTLCIIFT